jgi:hypothetical protein
LQAARALHGSFLSLQKSIILIRLNKTTFWHLKLVKLSHKIRYLYLLKSYGR